MSDRILELAQIVWPDPGVSHENHRKFARLLINECIAEARDEAQYQAGWAVAETVVARLERHFGIE